MNITKELIKKVAHQSKLNLSDDEIEKLIPQLKEILDIFSKLDKDAKYHIHLSRLLSL